MVDNFSNQNPDPKELADEEDELAWDREKHGKMRDHSMPDNFVETVSWEEKK